MGVTPPDLLGNTPKKEEVRIIAANVEDTPEDDRIIRKQMKDSAITFTHDRRGTIAQGYAVDPYPSLYVIDQTGTISAVHVGFDDTSLLEIVDDINKAAGITTARRGAWRRQGLNQRTEARSFSTFSGVSVGA